MKNAYLEAGRFTSTHGVKGDIKAECWCDDVSVLRQLKTVYLKSKDGYTPLKVVRCVPYRDLALMHIEGYETPEAGAPLKNRVFYAAREDLPLEEGSFFIADLIGLTVYDVDDGRKYGVIKDVINRGSSDIYVVNTDSGERMMPAVEEFVKKVDIDGGKVYVKPIEGLLSDN